MSKQVYGRQKKMFGNDKINSRDEEYFKCNYCLYEFWHYIGTSGGEKHNRASTQVKCPICKNFLKNPTL